MTTIEKVQLISAKVQILALKADDYNWQCHTPPVVKQQLEATLVEIETLLSSEADK